MWSFVKATPRVLALILLTPHLLPHFACAEGDRTAPNLRDAVKSSSNPPSIEPTCEARTVNYITDSLPQQCLTAGSVAPIPVPETVTTAVPASSSISASTSTSTSTSITITTSTHAIPPASTTDAVHEELDPVGEDLSTGAFMSFEEWKAMMLAKSGPDAFDARPRRVKDGRADAGPGEGFDSLGDEGEISFDFDAYSDRISEMASSARPREREEETKEVVEKVTYDEGFTYYRSKDAGTTCKERFSYSSFDAGATVKKTSSGAKNPTAILMENKDSYMLLECGMKNKFFIVELSDVILVDTVVIANFEFFSSMVRQFRVSISDRYPVKLDKWKVLGTFEARNSRDLQPFLVENPQDWARYLRVEILSHYGNEYYCPVSLLRVHGLRMLDSWKGVDPSDLESEDEGLPSTSWEPAEEIIDDVDEEEPVEPEVVEMILTETYNVTVEQSRWVPYWEKSYFEYRFSPVNYCAKAAAPDRNEHHGKDSQQTARSGLSSAYGEAVSSAMPNTSVAMTSVKETAEPSSDSVRAEPLTSPSGNRSISSTVSMPAPSSMPGSGDDSNSPLSKPPISQTMYENATVQSVSKSKPSSSTTAKSSSPKSLAKTPSGSQTTARSKTTSTTSSVLPTPTMQDSFFKALTKRLQILESNSTLSLQYIESQSRYLQEALAKLERRQVAKVDLFLDRLNNTVLNELREVRTLYDHIWQSTVIALESQREQTENEIVALSTRVGVLADEVVFQKRMAIVQSVLLLGCLVLVIFSRGFAGSAVDSYYPSQFLMSPSRLASPILPPTPSTQIKGIRTSDSPFRDQSSTNTTPVRPRSARDSAQRRLRTNNTRPNNSSHTPSKPRSRPGSKGSDLHSIGGKSSLSKRALPDPPDLDFQPPTPSSMDMAYDSEPTMTPNGNYFSATTSMHDDSSVDGGDEGGGVGMYSDLLARQSEHQLTPTSEADGSEYILSRSGRPGLTHSGSTRKPLPALPEDPD